MSDPILNVHPVFVEVLLPLAIPQTYTYAVPIDFVPSVGYGIRVEVPLRNKLYAGIVMSVHKRNPISKTRNIISVLDRQPVIREEQFVFWKWMADYYCTTLGEVMGVALPSGLKLSSETKLIFNEGINLEVLELSDSEDIIAEAISIQHELTIDAIQDILNKKTVYPVIKSLMEKRVISIKEELKQKYKALTADFISMKIPYRDDIEEALKLTTRSEKQSRALLSIATLSRRQKHVAKKSVYEMAQVGASEINALVKKGIIEIYKQEISRIDLDGELEDFSLSPLTTVQEGCLIEIKKYHENNKVVLLHGITGSGKTRIYVELILETLAAGGQALLLLPEIALTSQIVARLEAQIFSGLLVYHSRINHQQRVEIWNAAMFSNKLFVGARSSLFLPFADLQLVIVDEEHDTSYKQVNPNPKYQGRDAAIKLAHIYNAKVVLGSATPSLESIQNCNLEKFGYVSLFERFGNSILPEIEIVDLKKAYKEGRVKDHMSSNLIEAIESCISKKEQVLIFQNRRGYAPIQKCQLCGWTAECPSCDTTLTYHQRINDLKCHYCGYRQKKVDLCPDCGSHELMLLGLGTEGVEEVIEKLIPHAKVARFDYDTTRSKQAQEKILYAFKKGEIDVLVGTQMITKGFDFENIALVGVISADGLLGFPDFRASERSFQLLLQVSGRAGRREQQGKVLIQAFKTDHPVLREVVAADYNRFFQRELEERKHFIFPPLFYRIAIWFRHRDLTKTRAASVAYAQMLSSQIGKRMQGPVDPSVIRVRNQYQQVIFVRIEKDYKMLKHIKSLIIKVRNKIKTDKELRQVSISIDVDP